MSLNLSSTTDNVDLIYNGLSDKYETLYPFLRDVNNEGGLTLLTKEEMENKQARILTCCYLSFTMFLMQIPCSIVSFNSFLFIKNKRLFISSEGFSTLEKNALICYQRAMLPFQSGVTTLMAVWRPFCLNSNFLGRV
jgi:hypothetical protein